MANVQFFFSVFGSPLLQWLDDIHILAGAVNISSPSAGGFTARSGTVTMQIQGGGFSYDLTPAGVVPVDGTISSISVALSGTTLWTMNAFIMSYAELREARVAEATGADIGALNRMFLGLGLNFAADFSQPDDIAQRDTYLGGLVNLTGNDRFFLDNGDDRFAVSDGDDAVAGESGEDTLYGEAGQDTLVGGTEDDELSGGDGDDSLDGGDQNDTVSGDAGHDVVDGGAGNDRVNGGSGNDTVTGGDDDDKVEGGKGRDTLTGGTGDDTLQGGGGGDLLYAGRGNDKLSGGAGADVIEFAGPTGDDTVTGFDVVDDLLRIQGTAVAFDTVAQGVRVSWADGSVLVRGVVLADLDVGTNIELF